MNEVFLWILFIAGNLLFWFGSMRDYKSSMKQNSHGLAENDIFKLNRDKYGYFSPSRFWTVHLIYWAVVTATALILYAYTDRDEKHLILFFFSLLFYLPVAGASLWIAYRNNNLATRTRNNVQIPILQRLSELPQYDYDAVESVFIPHGFWKRNVNGRIRAVMFPFLYMDGVSDEQFEERFYKAIYDIAKKGKAQWFANTELKKLN